MTEYRIESTGNGATWTVTRLADGETRFLQGDDAVAFGLELDMTHDRYTNDDAASMLFE